MRAYYAIIKDSFREALSSRVLWILLVLFTLLLAAIVPLSITDHLPASLAPGDITSVAGLAGKLHKQAAAEADSPGKRIWTSLDESLRKRLADVAAKPEDRAAALGVESRLRGDLNELLSKRDLYDEAAWTSAKPGADAKALLARGVNRLNEDEVRRLNRLLLEAAFPLEIAQARPEEISFAYFGMNLGGPIPMGKELVVKSTLTGIMNFFLGTLGVFTAILVTASIVPHTFEAGAIDLLLSKPISRFWLYVTKFLGGCAFTLINAAYFITGLWLITGLRYGIWSGRLLLCIPLFMFLFAIYYSVSALAGVVWKNAIVCVVMAVVFWVACFAVGVSKNIVEAVFLDSRRLVRIEQVGDELVAVNERAEMLLWQPTAGAWQPIATSEAERGPRFAGPPVGMPLRTVGPVYDAHTRRLLVVRPGGGAGGFMSQAAELYAGRQAEDWRLSRVAAAPLETTGLFVGPKGEVIAVGASGVFRLEGDPPNAATAKTPGVADVENSKPSSTPIAAGSDRKFVEIGPSSGFGGQPAAAMDPARGALAVFNRERLRILKPDEQGHYAQASRAEIEGAQSAVVGYGGSFGRRGIGRRHDQVLPCRRSFAARGICVLHAPRAAIRAGLARRTLAGRLVSQPQALAVRRGKRRGACRSPSPGRATSRRLRSDPTETCWWPIVSPASRAIGSIRYGRSSACSRSWTCSSACTATGSSRCTPCFPSPANWATWSPTC